MQQESNEILLERFKAGNTSAIETVFRLVHKQYVYFAYRLIADWEASEDIVMDVFHRLLTSRHSITSIENVKAFVLVATRNACYDYLRKEKRDESVRRELIYLRKDEGVYQLDADRMEAELLQRIYDELDNLQPLARKVFVCRFFEGLDTSETANRLGLSEKTVRNYKAHAFTHLRAAILKHVVVLLLLRF